ncbi:4'-phosphopantetheinyl transferase family protein [Streptomyces longispororuber]|uniref:4'-phosphopantetheinyl transferase family protein n=1 Tax=Streptomyces longispororuber TaxID=68230 RepID=UPI00210C668E|nr:4'-phosphopantetheinyl transferase superfamily protein [Streptomyces longispororuber]MCQ4209077.1 4'-phosphopantetheinyl transferase superfamily protein [Streptomyces longispororuber]
MDRVRELPPAGAVRLWLVTTDADPAGTAGGTDVLDADERRRAAAFRQDRHRTRYVAAHLALRGILGERLGRPPGAVRFVRLPCPDCGRPHGRPALADVPGPHFSLSHSGDLALVAVADAPVGADIEALPTPETADELTVVLHPREQAELAALASPSERCLAVARTWVRKEAYLKGIGTGLARGADLDYVGTLPDSPTAPDGWTVRDVPVPSGYTAAVAIGPAVSPGGRPPG